MSEAFEVAGLLTHLLVVVLGAGGIIGVVPLARGRRAGAGLLLMAGSMGLVVLEPRWQLGFPGVAAYTMAFLLALWLLLGPERRKQRGGGGAHEERPQQGIGAMRPGATHEGMRSSSSCPSPDIGDVVQAAKKGLTLPWL